MAVPNPFKGETNKRNDDHLQKKWEGKIPYVDGVDCSGDPGRTDQSAARDADINNIVATYHKTGYIPPLLAEQVYGDVSDKPSYQEALQTIIDADAAFMALDARVRKRFDNNPAAMLEFLGDPNNRAEAVRLGIIEDKAPPPSPASPEASRSPAKPPKAASKSSPSSEGDDS